MINKILLFSTMLLFTSCAKNTFQEFYNQEKRAADFAISFPKYMAMIAIPKESKEDVKYFTEGMRKIRVLFDENKDERLIASFQDFAQEKGYVPYMVMKKDGEKVNIFTREDEDYIREIVLDVEAEDETIIVALMGKMKKSTFSQALKEASKGD